MDVQTDVWNDKEIKPRDTERMDIWMKQGLFLYTKTNKISSVF